MVREYKIPGFYLDQGRGFGPEEDLEFELALALQNGQPGDVRLLETLVEHYGAEIYQLVYALLDTNFQEKPLSDQICALVEGTFADAIDNLGHFWGESSVREWLFALALNKFNQHQRWQEIKQFIRLTDQPGEVWKKPEESRPRNLRDSNLWAGVDNSPERQRLVAILYYVFKFDIAGIARVLRAAETAIAEDLFAVLDQLLHVTVEKSASWFKVPPDIQGLIQAEVTGRLQGDIYRQEELRQHLSTCEDCRRYMKKLDDLDAALAGGLQRRWPSEPLPAVQTGRLLEGARSRLERPNLLQKLAQPIRKGAWIGLVMMLFVAVAWAVTRSGLLVGEIAAIPAPATPVPIQLPDPIEIPASAISIDEQRTAQAIPDLVYSIEPDISAGGGWIAFTHYDAFIMESQPSSLPEIILYNRIDQSMIRINNPTNGSRRINWGFNPSISGDGRWVVFASSEDRSSGSRPSECKYFGMVDECVGIFLFDRETGSVERIDRSYDGSEVNGDSYNPKISANGRWLTFWSSANNLVAERSDACTREARSLSTCSNLFIYDRETNEIKLVPIGRSREQQILGGKPSISSDGRLITLTIYKDDWIAAQLGLTNDQEAVVYDAKEGKFTTVNISNEGSIGNGGSHAPSISADGHFVAFVSDANDLVPGDTNATSDIFVQNLKIGTIERVSVSSDGKQGNSSRGETNIPWGSVVDISRDGRFVVFTSWMNDLSNQASYLCDHPQRDTCNSIYIHDRETGKTKRVLSPQRDRYYLFPEISEDGRWVTFMEMQDECSPESVQQVCGEVWIYDDQNEWTSAVSKGRFQSPKPRMFINLARRIPEVSAHMAMAPDGETVATVFNAKNHTSMINLWEIREGTHTTFIQADRESTITSLAFSPDGEYLAVGTQEGNVKIWRLSNQQWGYDIDGQTGRVIKILFSTDSKRIAIGTQHSLWVWELRDKTFVRVAVRELNGDGLVDLDISPDARWLALAMQDQTVWLQNIKTGKIVLRVENEGQNPLSVTYAPDGKTLAVGSRDGSLHLWELAEEAGDILKAKYQRNLAHQDGVSKVAFSPNGKYLVSLTLDGLLRIWSYPEGYILNALPESRWEKVNTFAISPKGDLLATSSWTGPTRIFRGSSEVEEPRFFIRAQSDDISIPLAFPPEASFWDWQSPPVNLYQASSLLDFDLLAPTYLPPGMIFRGVHYAQPNDTAWLQYQYYEDPQLSPRAALYITQEPIAPETSDLPVGNSAIIESVRVKDANAEFVQGDWVPAGNRSKENNEFGDLVPMKWDPNAVSLQLRFQAGARLISVLYKQDEVKNGEFLYLDKADLVAIAQSLVNVNRAFQTAPLTISYTVQEGDTCTSIASRFGTSVGALVHSNALPSNCDIIYAGQTLTVPLTEARETLTETDLDCDGIPERVLIIPNPSPTGVNTFLGVIVEMLSNTGFYQEAWRYTIADTGLRLFTQPQIFRVDDCNQDLAINLLPRNASSTQFEIYHWDGETMVNAVEPDIIRSPAP